MKRLARTGKAMARKYDNAWPNATLEELRLLREIALKDGNLERAFALAGLIDRKRGFY